MTSLDPIVIYVFIATILLAISSSMVGTFAYLQKRSLIGDAVAHAVLPGICLAFIFEGHKNPISLLIGAFISAWLSILLIDYITTKTKLSQDTALGIILSLFFGIGIMLLTSIQHMEGMEDQSGLTGFIFGNIVATSLDDIWVYSTVAVVLISSVVLFYKEFMIISFDQYYAQSIGISVKWIQLILTSITVLAIVIGIQSVGIILMAAMLITPAAAARLWTNDLKKVLIIAAIIGSLSGITGAYISYITPTPTGPWIVVSMSMIAILSFIFAPQKGVLMRYWQKRQLAFRIHQENVLKYFYQQCEQHNDFQYSLGTQEIASHLRLNFLNVRNTIQYLKSHGYVVSKGDKWQLSPEGLTYGQRLTRLHRLWELFLTQYMNIAPDHVHDDAEKIEHILTPEIEKQLETLLDFPEKDPHDEKIPYRKPLQEL